MIVNLNYYDFVSDVISSYLKLDVLFNFKVQVAMTIFQFHVQSGIDCTYQTEIWVHAKFCFSYQNVSRTWLLSCKLQKQSIGLFANRPKKDISAGCIFSRMYLQAARHLARRRLINLFEIFFCQSLTNRSFTNTSLFWFVLFLFHFPESIFYKTCLKYLKSNKPINR